MTFEILFNSNQIKFMFSYSIPIFPASAQCDTIDLVDGFLFDTGGIEFGVNGVYGLYSGFDISRYQPRFYDVCGIKKPSWFLDAIPKRQAEFLAGRLLTKITMERLGYHNKAVGISQDRSPIWPKGWLGSISHTGSHCVCMVTRSPHVMCGIDIEKIASGDALLSIWNDTLSASELDFISHFDKCDWARWATIVFSAKETLFKALYPQVQIYFDFTAASLSCPPNSSSLTFILQTNLGDGFAKGAKIDIKFDQIKSHVLTWTTKRVLSEKN